jgi:uncharacterized protein with HEPN domain
METNGRNERAKLIHAYFGVDTETLWKASNKTNIPTLKEPNQRNADRTTGIAIK